MAVALFDTNILVDCLKGYEPAITEVEYWNDPCISSITWMEVVAGIKGDEQTAVLGFLDVFRVIHIDDVIMRNAADLRRTSIHVQKKVALPDAIIMATGLIYADVIITRNRRDFRLAEALQGHVRTPYELANTSPVSFVNVVPPPGPPFVRRPLILEKDEDGFKRNPGQAESG